MTVAEVDALLYLPGHPRQQLLRALRIPALSPGWQASFQALLDGDAGTAATPGSPPRARRPPGPASGRWPSPAIDAESDSVISIRLADPDGAPLPAARARPVPDRARSTPGRATRPCCATTRCPGRPAAGYYRISVKREPHGAASGYLHTPARASATRSTSPRRAARSCSTTPTTPGAADQRRHRRDAGAGHAARARRAALRRARSGGCTARATGASTPSPPRPARSPRRCRTPAVAGLLQPPRPRRPRQAATRRAGRLTAGGARRARAARATPRPTSAARRRSWTRSAPAWRRSASTPHGSTPSRSDPRRGITPGIAARPRGAPHPPTGRAGTARSSSSPAATSPSPGATTTRACSSSPRRATSPSAGRAAPASATPARPPLHRRRGRLRPRPGRAARRGQRADLLLAAARRRRARPLSSPAAGRSAADEPSRSKLITSACVVRIAPRGICRTVVHVMAVRSLRGSSVSAPVVRDDPEAPRFAECRSTSKCGKTSRPLARIVHLVLAHRGWSWTMGLWALFRSPTTRKRGGGRASSVQSHPDQENR